MDKITGPGGLLYDKAGKIDPPKLVGLLVAAAAPILAIILSIIRSPGANTHAEHAGQRRLGRAAGVIGTLLVLGAMAAVAVMAGMIMADGPISDADIQRLGQLRDRQTLDHKRAVRRVVGVAADRQVLRQTRQFGACGVQRPDDPRVPAGLPQGPG